MSRDKNGTGEEIAPNVYVVTRQFVNAYFVGTANLWAIVDTGLPGGVGFEAVVAAANARFGQESRPTAIYLTHGHVDHTGGASALATYYDAPIFAHRRELPYITGKSDYPPGDPAVGGPMGLAARLVGKNGSKGCDLSPNVRELPAPGEPLPGLGDGWQFVETPGHAPGQVAFFRESDKVLLAGDAVMTVILNTFRDLLRLKTPHIARPPSSFTTDWVAARRSIGTLADLQPHTIAPGHGTPMRGGQSVANDLRGFADDFSIPLNGRYVSEPATADETGTLFVPPPALDSFPKTIFAVVLVLVAFLTLGFALKQRGKKS